MQVRNKEYYHIHRKEFASDKWKIGNKIVFCKDYYNYLFDYYLKFNLQKSDNSIPDNVKIKEYTMLIRELVYEEVRTAYYPSLPSRRHCAWLCDKNELELWKNTLGGDFEIYKVIANGNIHECYAGALEDDNINFRILYEKAIAYWNGECIGNPLEKEYLFEGEIVLVDKM